MILLVYFTFLKLLFYPDLSNNEGNCHQKDKTMAILFVSLTIALITTSNITQERKDPGPLKCLSAPRHQILAKSAPQKTRNRDKAEFATKVRISS